MSNSNYPRLKKGLLTAGILAALIVATELLLQAALPLLPRWETFQRLETKIEAASAKPSYDVLFFGDSSALYGISPALFTQATSLSSYNFATLSTVAPYANIFLLRRYLAAHASPRAVILLFNIQSATTRPSLPIFRRYFYEPDTYAILRESDAESDGGFDYYLSALLPSYRNREQILQGFGMLLAGQQSEQLYDGYVPRTEIAHIDPDVLQQFLGNDDTGLLWKSQIDLLQKFCEEADAAHIPVYLSLGPVPQTGYATGLEKYALQVVKYIQGAVSNSKNCTVDPNVYYYRDDLFADHNHVNQTGATLLTQALAQKVQQALGVQSSP